MKYSKKEFVDDERRKKVERMVYTILILTMAPSIYLTYNMVKENFFEVAASRFVSQNFNYADTQVLSKSAVKAHHTRLFGGGRNPERFHSCGTGEIAPVWIGQCYIGSSSRVWAKSSGYKYFEQCDV